MRPSVALMTTAYPGAGTGGISGPSGIFSVISLDARQFMASKEGVDVRGIGPHVCITHSGPVCAKVASE